MLEHGKKWSKVSKMLGGKRTEHMVKNRFKSLYHFETKKHDKKQAEKSAETQVLEELLHKLACRLDQPKLT